MSDQRLNPQVHAGCRNRRGCLAGVAFLGASRDILPVRGNPVRRSCRRAHRHPRFCAAVRHSGHQLSAQEQADRGAHRAADRAPGLSRTVHARRRGSRPDLVRRSVFHDHVHGHFHHWLPDLYLWPALHEGARASSEAGFVQTGPVFLFYGAVPGRHERAGFRQQPALALFLLGSDHVLLLHADQA